MTIESGLVDASTLLATLTILAVVELSTSLRDSDHLRVPDENQIPPEQKIWVFPIPIFHLYMFGRFAIIHLINNVLLGLGLLFFELSFSTEPLGVVTVVFILFWFILPVIEIEQYDEWYYVPYSQLEREVWYNNYPLPFSLTFHIVSVFGMIVVSIEFPALGLPLVFAFAFVSTYVFGFLLRKDMARLRKCRAEYQLRDAIDRISI